MASRDEKESRCLLDDEDDVVRAEDEAEDEVESGWCFAKSVTLPDDEAVARAQRL